MNETLLTALLGYLTTMLVAAGGWMFAYLMQRDAKRRRRLERQVARLEGEVRARIALEKAACEWLSEVTDKTPRAAKLELRNRAQARSGLRPKLASSDLSASGVEHTEVAQRTALTPSPPTAKSTHHPIQHPDNVYLQDSFATLCARQERHFWYRTRHRLLLRALDRHRACGTLTRSAVGLGVG